MNYRVVISNSAEKEIALLPVVYYPAVRNAILSLAENPRPRNSKKLKGFHNTYRIRVGVYRIVYNINDKIRIVTITKVAHRQKIY